MLFSLVVLQFSCAYDSFAKSDRTATDCCVKNVSFLCLSGGIFHGSLPHFGFILSRSQDPKYTRYEMFQPIRKYLTILSVLETQENNLVAQNFYFGPL